MQLNENISLISDVVNVNVTDSSCINDHPFEIQFQINSTTTSKTKNITCAQLFGSTKWQVTNNCKLNSSSPSNVSCFCKEPGTYALMEFQEEKEIESVSIHNLE